MCSQEERIYADNKEELVERIRESDWKNLNSDKYKMTGHWCGNCKIG